MTLEQVNILSQTSTKGKNMTLDELQAEAERRGYRLTKIAPTVKLLPCPVCGRGRTEEWVSTRGDKRGYLRICNKCRFEADWGKTKLEAKQKWNEAVLKYKEEN